MTTIADFIKTADLHGMTHKDLASIRNLIMKNAHLFITAYLNDDNCPDNIVDALTDVLTNDPHNPRELLLNLSSVVSSLQVAVSQGVYLIADGLRDIEFERENKDNENE